MRPTSGYYLQALVSARLPTFSPRSCRLKRPYATATADASTSSSTRAAPNSFPFPTQRNPTPHQIFHLPRNASDADIKARYIDLVRLYHPDKLASSSSVTAELAHERFQAITAAYDILRGKTPAGLGPGSTSGSGTANVDTAYQTTAAWRAMRQKRQELYNSGAVDDSWKDRLILAGVVGTVLFVLFHTHTTRREALADMVDQSRRMASSQRVAVAEREARRRDEDRLALEDKESNS